MKNDATPGGGGPNAAWRKGGRKADATPRSGGPGGGWNDPTFYARKRAVEAQIGRALTSAEFRSPEHWVAPDPGAFTGHKRKATATPTGSGGGAWRDPTVYKRKAAAEAKTGVAFESLDAFRKSEHWVPPPADNFSQDGLNAKRAKADPTPIPGGLTLGAMATKYTGEGSALPGGAEDSAVTGTSIFDPVLTELTYRWFCPPGGLVLDPFAGGSVRGIVASWLGRRYVGIDLSERQIEANRQQAEAICAGKPTPEWRVGDARDLAMLARDVEADFLVACPPYWNLERYSDDARDLSTLDDFSAFYDAYAKIVCAACERLKPDRFACFVVGDVRDSRGFYVGLPRATIAAFELAGLGFYNDAVLVTACGSLPVRVRGQFEGGRKLGKTHQNVLVFCKGDPRKATDAVGPVEFGEIGAAGEGAAPAVPASTGAPAQASTRGDIGGEV